MSDCSWCEKCSCSNELTLCKIEDDQPHRLCPSCHLTGHACQSSCPSCWYQLAQILILRDYLCAGCIKPLNERKKFDEHGHFLCCQCEQCLLCAFREERGAEFFSRTYREHEPRIQNILYLMQMCVQRMEREREPCSICMEPLYENGKNPVKILDACQHRFHIKCIDQWFEEKPCCPCCRHVYHNHDEPSNTLRLSLLKDFIRLFLEFKRTRRTQFNTFQSRQLNPYQSNAPMDTY